MGLPLSSSANLDLEALHTCAKSVSCYGRSSKVLLLSVVSGISASIIVIFVTKRIMGGCQKKHDLGRLRETKESERCAQFQKIRSYLGEKTPEEFAKILSLPFEELRSKLQSRELTSKDTLEAFVFKTLELAEKLNCVTEFVPDIFEVAKRLDNMVLIQGPLHGMPFCVNEDIDLAGSWSTFSCSRNMPTSCPSTETAVMVKLLESQGAIPFCRTSTSIICLSFGGRNPYFGEINNPLNTSLSVGGSSCGVACLVQGGGSPFGVGTDRAGGARVPAHFTGISTLKPSRHRVSRRGCIQHCVGTTSVPCIMSKRVSEIIAISRFVMEKNQLNKLDPKAIPLPWNMQICESKQKLRIGYFTYFPAFPPLGDTDEALRKAKTYLESCGHIVVSCEPPDDLKCQEVWSNLMKVHTHRHVARTDNKTTSSQDEHNSNQISPRILWADETRRVRRTQVRDSAWKRFTQSLDHISGRKSSQDRAIECMRASMNSDCDLWNTASLREQFVDEVLDNMNSLDVDVILCPVFGHVATTSSNMLELGLLPGVYSYVWNLLDLPAGVVRVWKESGKYLNEKFTDSVGMPIGIQIVGRPYAEEMVLRVMSELDELNDNYDTNENQTRSMSISRARKTTITVE